MSNLEKVRMALEKHPGNLEALHELCAHEQEVAALVEAARNILCEVRDRSSAKANLRAALRPFTGDEK